MPEDGAVDEIKKTDNRLDTHAVTLIKQEGSRSPKRRAKAAEARVLVPFAHELAIDLLDAANPMEATVMQCAAHLQECYNSLSVATFNADVLAEQSRKLCLLWVALLLIPFLHLLRSHRALQAVQAVPGPQSMQFAAMLHLLASK
jgi:hypothetical protein